MCNKASLDRGQDSKFNINFWNLQFKKGIKYNYYRFSIL